METAVKELNRVVEVDRRLDFGSQVRLTAHRSVWERVIEHIRDLHHSEGVLLDGFIENRFGWHLRQNAREGVVPYTRDWVGILHNPPNMPAFWDRNSSPDGLITGLHFQRSLEYCRGIFVLSDYLRNWLTSRVDVPVVTLRHPTELEVPQFSFDQYRREPVKQIVQVGFWLRKFNSLRHLPLPEGFAKICIIPTKNAAEYEALERRYANNFDQYGRLIVGTYRQMKFQPEDVLDRMLTKSLVFLDLYDSSANNAVLECIARSTPVLVNPLPAVVEYLGEDYPLYFDSLGEAAEKASDMGCVEQAHQYLKMMGKQALSYDNFRNDFINSSIYKSLPAVSSVVETSFQTVGRVDKLEDLNLIEGVPLSCRYIFIICFRNIDGKLMRCIESICRQNHGFDFGVVVVDDCSDSSVSPLVFQEMKKRNVPFVFVANKSRKYFTRNLYNAVNLLSTDDDSIIIEVDGDDYLEQIDVLQVLHRYYKHGAEKTFGSFRQVSDAVNSNFGDTDEIHTRIDTRQPWNLDVCTSWLHLKTYRRELFRKVPLPYFLERGSSEWLRLGEDMVVHPKMIELSDGRAAYVADTLYVYDVSGDEHDVLSADHAWYVTERLHRSPTGRFIAQCHVRQNKVRFQRH